MGRRTCAYSSERALITASRQRLAGAVNAELTWLYWTVGQRRPVAASTRSRPSGWRPRRRRGRLPEQRQQRWGQAGGGCCGISRGACVSCEESGFQQIGSSK
jgi:hypothetical protein